MLIEDLLRLGAVEAFLMPVQMKKNRLGVVLTVLCSAENLLIVQEHIFRETTSFGMRICEKSRVILERQFQEVTTPFGPVKIKLGLRNGQIVQRSPEFETCRRLALETGHPLKEIYAAAQAAAILIETKSPD